MPVSVCTVQYRSVVFIFLRASIEGCTHLDKCRSSTLAVNQIMFSKVDVCLQETKKDARSVCGSTCGNISARFQGQKTNVLSNRTSSFFYLNTFLFPFVFCIIYEVKVIETTTLSVCQTRFNLGNVTLFMHSTCLRMLTYSTI